MKKDFKMCIKLDFYGPILSPKQFKMMNLYYNEDLSLGEIAQLIKITRQGVSDAVKKAERIIDDFESKVGLFRRFVSLNKHLEELKSQAENLLEINNKELNNKDVHQAIQCILKDIQNIRVHSEVVDYGI